VPQKEAREALTVVLGMLAEAGVISASGVAGLLSAAVPGGAGSSPTRLGRAQAVVLCSRKEGGDAALTSKRCSPTYLLCSLLSKGGSLPERHRNFKGASLLCN